MRVLPGLDADDETPTPDTEKTAPRSPNAVGTTKVSDIVRSDIPAMLPVARPARPAPTRVANSTVALIFELPTSRKASFNLFQNSSTATAPIIPICPRVDSTAAFIHCWTFRSTRSTNPKHWPATTSARTASITQQKHMSLHILLPTPLSTRRRLT